MIVLEANYAKKLGLPGYSSHQYSLSIRTELTELSKVEAESVRLYQLLQTAVDKDIQEVGFIPDADTYGTNGHANGNGHVNGHTRNGNGNGNGRSYQPNGNVRPYTRSNNGQPQADRWNCTDGQKGFIQRIVNENNLDKNDVEDLSQQLFGLGVKQLNKMQASQLIDELLAKAGQPHGRAAQWTQQQPATQAA